MRRHLVCLLLLAAALSCPVAARGEAAESVKTRYLRAVYVLRTLNAALSAGSLAIPRRIITDDTTNALVRHPDKIFVLTTLARELEELTLQNKSLNDAAYYAAHAWYTLGRRADAARLMDRYLLTAPCRPEDHLFLLRCLYENGDAEKAERAAETLSRRYPKNAKAIQALREQLREAERSP